MDRRLEVGVQPPFQWIEAAGTRVAASISGQGRPVLCLHATGHGGRDFEIFANLVAAEGFEVAAIDWPGQGRSPADQTGEPLGAARYGQIARAAAEVLFGDRRPIVVGCSVGGMAALSWAHAAPDTVQALVLCNPGGLAPIDPASRLAIGAMTGFFRAGAAGAWWFPMAMKLYYQLVLPAPAAQAQRRRIVEGGREIARLAAEAWSSFGQPESDLRAVLSELDLPVLFAWAMDDRIVAWSRSREAVEAYRKGVIRGFRGGHAAFLEDPFTFAEAFQAFARTLAAPAS